MGSATQREQRTGALSGPEPPGAAELVTPEWCDAGGSEVPTVRAELPADALAASAARRFLRSALAQWGIDESVVYDAALLVSELATNAVVHAGTAVQLECRHETTGLVVEVSDAYPALPVAVRNDGGGQGHGLRLVGTLAEEWGVSYRQGRKTVWFRLALAPADSAPGTVRAPAPSSGVALASAAAESAGPEAAEPSPHPRRDDAHASAPPSGKPEAERGLPGPSCSPESLYPVDRECVDHGTVSFLAEASDLLAGQLDEDKVASLAGQLLVPRFADWCAVWLEDGELGGPLRLARVWHRQEDRIDELRRLLEKEPPGPAPGSPHALSGQAVPWHLPLDARAEATAGRRGANPPSTARRSSGRGADGEPAAGEPATDRAAPEAVICRLIAGGRAVGTLAVGRGAHGGASALTGEVLRLVEDFARRVALSVRSARRYTRQATISQVLQRGLLPSGDVAIPHTETAVVYEPAGEDAWAGGDFYDFFAAGDGRWCFALGDVCGNGPEAAVVTGLARPVLRLLAREGYSVPETLDRLNREVGEQARFLSLVFGELTPRDAAVGGGVECTVASAGHPLPLVRDTSGAVRAAARPQLLLGIVEDARYDSQTFTLAPGETLLCVTDGVTERRSGARQFDDGDGLATVLAECSGMDAAGTAQRVRQAVHDFASGPPVDDLALLVLRAVPHGG